ncbi:MULTISPECIES: acetyltransferase [unclassified Lentimonas]|uniref:acetyltransferase n=1 Tax=unclassified Lentimonas TaxID=2630993 RepID=UPI0013274812|nr:MULTISPECIES: acetyltransferase [unclassified Lentimonas]CAA6694157.1 Unannotated [Lentimonas sp. CC10]CAA6694343.1 Unannotated [Lentimonas sp. CC19]CAA7071095.1 Unannotated [Lentimonas sp. CC11]
MENSNLKKLVIVGAGGHGREVLWLAGNINKVRATYEILGFCDDNESLQGQTFSGLPVLGRPEDLDLTGALFFVVGVGDNATRKKIAERVEALGWRAETLIDPSAIVADDVSIGAGTYVGVVSNISPTAVIGRHAIVHNQSSVGHDTNMADFSQVSPGGRVLGHVNIGECGYIGSNAVVCPLKNVGAYAVLGACSFAIADIPDHSVALGVPARLRIKAQS